MYHVEVLNACVRLLTQLYAAQKAGLSLCQEAHFALDAGTSSPERKAGPGEGTGSEARWLVRAVRVLSRHVLYTADPALMQLPQCDSDVTDVRDVLRCFRMLGSTAGERGKRWIWTAYGSWEPQALQLLRHSTLRPLCAAAGTAPRAVQ